MRSILTVAFPICIVLCAFCLLIAFSNYHLYVEGTIDEHDRLIHEQWRMASAKRYFLAACVFAVLALARLLKGSRPRH
jgi:hypothetical protein